jgi:hypothetical protein
VPIFLLNSIGFLPGIAGLCYICLKTKEKNMFLVELALALIAFGGGLFLLSKAKAQNLSGGFKLGAWLMIVVSILIMLCVGARSIMCATHQGECRYGMGGEMGCGHECMMGDHHDGKGDKCCDMKDGHKMHGSDSTMSDSMHHGM